MSQDDSEHNHPGGFGYVADCPRCELAMRQIEASDPTARPRRMLTDLREYGFMLAEGRWVRA